jgi:hypothetical protein
VHRILATASILLSLLNPTAAIPRSPPPLDDPLQSCEAHAEAVLGLLKAITVVEGQFFGTPAWRQRLSQMQEGLADLPSPVVAHFLAGKLQPLTNEPGNQEYLTTFTAKRQTFYERMLVHSNPVEMTEALLNDATRIENMMAALPVEEHARLRFGQPEAFEQFDVARFRLWEVHQFGPCRSTPRPDLH